LSKKVSLHCHFEGPIGIDNLQKWTILASVRQTPDDEPKKKVPASLYMVNGGKTRFKRSSLILKLAGHFLDPFWTQ
jgi:hypothetical protein